MTTETWTDALDRSGHFVTEPRKRVAELLVGREEHFTAEDVLRDAKRRRLPVGRATVFRALELFEELGLVERLDLPNGNHAYVVCQPSHHHHIVCTSCGRTEEIADLGLERLAAKVDERTGFSLDSHRIELYGLCPTCRGSSSEPSSSTEPIP
jgi:Fur family transcriptional regulator, ferric uptake regulator